MFAVLRRPGVLALLTLNVLSRIAPAGAGVLIVVHTHALTGSYAAAGAVAAASALSLALAAPLLGGIVDRRGQTGVLVVSGAVSGGAFLALALLPSTAPTVAIAAVAAVAGGSQPPLGACLRTLWPDLLDHDEDAVDAAFSLEAAVLELTYIAGPLGFLTLAALASSRVSVGVLGALVVVGTIAFALRPESRAWRPHDHGEDAARAARSALAAPGVRMVVAVMAMVGVLVAAVEVAVAAASHDAGAAGATGPLLALWGVGSLVGGVLAARTGGVRNVPLLLVALAVSHGALALGATTPVLLGAILVVAGAFIAPTFGAMSALTGRVAPPGTATEAFAWTTTALGAGVAAGAAIAGVVVDAAGPAAAFAAAGALTLPAAAVAVVYAPHARAPLPAG
ncbi:MAG TPA: MFS transporter [Baekduia sp.]|uniref:MFS transporter n=1 Tax=Baekduia sp. TaxID=2600305 RepID=UPI002D782892|nr:MFS transporter [Baekduia sp.]HET6506826.1 MFS transporter [Baekduia sp.]